MKSDMRKAFERFRKERNERLTKEGHDHNSKWWITNKEYPVWRGACEWRASHKAQEKSGEWIELIDLLPGYVFETEDGILAVKSEYFYSNGNPQPQCILLASGEYAHFEGGPETLVRAVGIPDQDLPAKKERDPNEPLPCPFCGWKGVEVAKGFGDDGSMGGFVCGCPSGPGVFFPSGDPGAREVALSVWNTRGGRSA